MSTIRSSPSRNQRIYSFLFHKAPSRMSRNVNSGRQQTPVRELGTTVTSRPSPSPPSPIVVASTPPSSRSDVTSPPSVPPPPLPGVPSPPPTSSPSPSCTVVLKSCPPILASKTSPPPPTPSSESELLACNVCLEPYDDELHEAKFLACHHSFCAACLVQIFADERIECPTCRHATHLTSGGVGTLQSNFYVSALRDSMPTGRTVAKTRGCRKHSNQPLNFFCTHCMTTICRDCTVLDHRERDGHALDDVQVADETQRGKLTRNAESGNRTLNDLRSHMNTLDSELQSLAAAKERELSRLEETFSRFSNHLEYRRLEMTKLLLDGYSSRQTRLVSRFDSMSVQLGQLSSQLGSCPRTAQHGSLADVVRLNQVLDKMIADLSEKLIDFKVGRNLLSLNLDVGSSQFMESVRKLGQPRPHQNLPAHVSFSVGSIDAVACIPVRVPMTVSAADGVNLKAAPTELAVVVKDPLSEYVVRVSDTANRGLELRFVPQISGRHVLTPVLGDTQLSSLSVSLTVASNNPVVKLGERGDGKGTFSFPRAIAIDTDGSLFIADTGNKLIQKLDSNGRFVMQFAVNGSRPECSTCDVALNTVSKMLVCTETQVGSGANPSLGKTILVFDTDGTLRRSFTNKAMKCALCVGTNRHGEIFVSDYLVHTIFVYDADGNFLKRVGHGPTFNHPAFIFVDDADRIIVSDTYNHCVQLFDRNGNFLRQFGRQGTGKGELMQPFGVASDGQHILVVDSGNKRIQVFTTGGDFVSMIESAADPLDQPRGIVLTTDGHLLVADRDSHCIKKYRYK